MKKNDIDISIIVTAHHEGFLAHKTMMCLFNCIKEINDSGYTHEIIVHIDNGDKETKAYFERYQGKDNILVVENDFGDVGASRNYAIRRSRGKYLAIIDADDLVSSNWIKESLSLLKDKKTISLVHPMASLTFEFGSHNHVLWLQKESFDIAKDTKILAVFNRWTATVVGHREAFLQIQYPLSGNGYGNEDYWFNTETTAHGIRHYAAKNVVLFYRRKPESVLSMNQDENSIIRPSKLFAIDEIHKLYIPGESPSRAKSPLMTLSSKVSRKIKIYLKDQQKIPPFVLNAWKNINKIETQLYPTEADLRGTTFYDSDISRFAGEVFCRLIHDIKKRPDYTFVVPWIVPGGADKLLLNYIAAIKKAHPEWHLAVITTLPSNNEWRHKVPDGVDFVDFGNQSNTLNEFEKDAVFSMLISQTCMERIHIINSDYCYKWVARHKKYSAKNLIINVSAFCYVRVDGKDRVFSYIDPDLCEIYDVVQKVFTDNQAVIDEAMAKNGFVKNKFIVHYQPFQGTNRDIKKDPASLMRRKKRNKIHILWASRITDAKMPEIAISVAKSLPKNYELDMYGRIDDESRFDKKIFRTAKNLKYRGSYNNFSEIPTENYDIFLYTTNSDGLPNVLLEVAEVNLPIIASNAGGVKDFIKNNETGILINDIYNIEQYVDAIVSLGKEEGTRLAINAQNLLEEQHAEKRFLECVKKDIR